MITQEFIRRAMSDMSGTEIDFYLYLFRVVDWDGNVRAIVEQIAASIDSTVAYVRHLIEKGIRKGLLVRDEYQPDLIRFTLASTDVHFDAATTRYCKKFEFFYTSKFRSLGVNAKRILLLAALRMSVNNMPNVVFDKTEIFYRLGSVTLNLPLDDTKYQLALSQINKTMMDTVKVAQACDRLTKKTQLIVTFAPETLSAYYENHTELFLLQRTVSLLGMDTVIEHAHCVEMLKTAKYLMRVVEDRRLARSIFNQAIEQMKSFVRSEGDKSPAGASAYFSKLIHEVMKKEMIMASHQIQNYEELRGTFNLILNEKRSRVVWLQNVREITIFDKDYDTVIGRYRRTIHNLIKACEKWFRSRVKGEVGRSGMKPHFDRLKMLGEAEIASLIEKGNEFQAKLNNGLPIYEIQQTVELYREKILTILSNPGNIIHQAG